MDDAGRGPVIGPMVLAGCLISDEVGKKLKKLGVKDSKQLTQKRREYLEKIIKEEAEAFEIIIICPEKIDGDNANGIKLNELEGIGFAGIINKINKGYGKMKVIIDCPSPTISKWQDFVKTKVNTLSNLDVSCEHKADKNHISAAAASVLAKCTREREMDKIKKIFGGEVGSGYCSDPATQKFLEKHAKKHQDKGIFRKTWITWKKAYEKISQRTLC